MHDFDFDVMERKRIASGARHRKCGSKSKKCSLPTDNMTQKQWKERNGKVLSYKMNAPMEWAQFKELPADIQSEYINGLVDRFGATATDLGKMFGVGAPTVSKHCKDCCRGVVFHRGNRMSAEKREAFSAFCGWSEAKGEEGASPAAEETNPAGIRRAVSSDTVVAPANAAGMAMNRFSLRFSGPFDAGMMMNSLAYMLPDGTEAEVEIICTVKNT